jgi:hypothetical protein
MKIIQSGVIAALLLAAMPALAAETVYKWTDSEGHLQYGDRATAAAHNKRLDVRQSASKAKRDAYAGTTADASGSKPLPVKQPPR